MYITKGLCIFASPYNNSINVNQTEMNDIQKMEFKIAQVEARIYSWKRKVAVFEIDPYVDEVETDKMLDEISKLKQRIEELKKNK